MSLRNPLLTATRTLFLSVALAAVSIAQTPEDENLWLEEVDGAEAMAWVEEHNAATLFEFRQHEMFDSLYERTLDILNSDDRIAYPSIRGNALYNFWQDAEHERGILRRTSWEEYLNGEPDWQTVIDIDALAEAEDENWVYKGVSCLAPEHRHCLVRLSRGGADAVEIREFDMTEMAFVDDGFFLPESKGGAAWMDENTLLVSTNFGEGTMTTSGYPRVVKRWERGTDLSSAQLVFEGEETDVGSWAGSFEMDGDIIPVISHSPRFFESFYHIVTDEGTVQVDIQSDASPNLVSGQLALYLRSDWTVGEMTYPGGSLIAMDYERFMAGERDFEMVLEPDDRQTIDGVSSTGDYLLVNLLDNVQGELHRFRLEDGEWIGEQIPAAGFGNVSVASTDSDTNRFFFTYTSFLQPTTLYFADDDGTIRELRSLPAMFDAEGLTVQQFEATSVDGTEVPYFVVHRENIALDGSNPTLLYGYGGFEISLTPSYGATTGANWLERGGVYAVANIRGGGEFGPEWHRSAQLENRQRAYDDFIAVAEDLIERGITSSDHLGIQGGSNGGLLVGVAFTQRPDLFNAVVCSVPLLDMQRYNKLLAGASWMAEYGNPDVPEDWAYIQEYSPYHNLSEDTDYPRVLFTTTTQDDRVHPGHARKMAARMENMGNQVYYFENTEGGHGAGVTPEQRATMTAVIYTYLWDRLQ
ncbi:MAG: prolyl oligopeptidase family serine peptidase [Rubricoccaceae bacterium]|nr:prolyl oligopeptidase family serine peptidase [Rubricoccaceae bacterium]